MTSLRCYAVISALFFGALSDAAVIHLPTLNGAKEAIPHSHPWQVLLNVHVPGERHYTACSGAVIPACDNCDGSDLVLTAAHCVYNESTRHRVKPHFVKAFAGLHNTSKLTGSEVQEVSIKEIVLHPGYSPQRKSHDIAVLRTNVPFKFDDTVMSVSLPVWNEPASIGAQCKIAGWGQTSMGSDDSKVLLELNATVVDDAACLKYFRRGYQKEIMLCAEASVLGGSTACPGDSGGPLVCPDKDGRPTVYGVVSFGDEKKCDGHKQTIYANVATFAKWIRETSDRITAMKK